MKVSSYWAVLLTASLAYGLFVFPPEFYQMARADMMALRWDPSFLSGVYLPLDSALYLENAKDFSISTVLDLLKNVSSFQFGLLSNITLFAIGKLAFALAPSSPYLVIAVVNHALLALAVSNYTTVCRELRLNSSQFRLLLLVNCLIVLSLYSLNKEAVGIYLVSVFSLYSVRGRTWQLGPGLVAALFTRDLFFAFGLLVIARRRWNVRLGVVLIGLSLLFPAIIWLLGGLLFGETFGDLTSPTVQWEQQTSAVLVAAFRTMSYPLGYLLAFPVVAIINIASPMLNLRDYVNMLHQNDLSVLTQHVSSFCFVVLLGAALHRAKWRALLADPMFQLFMSYLVLLALYPVSQHRYLLPVYPVVVLTYLSTRANSSRSVAPLATGYAAVVSPPSWRGVISGTRTDRSRNRIGGRSQMTHP